MKNPKIITKEFLELKSEELKQLKPSKNKIVIIDSMGSKFKNGKSNR